MNIWETIKMKLPVSRETYEAERAQHEADVKKEREQAQYVIAQRQKEIEAERLRALAKVDDLVAQLSRIRFAPDYHSHGQEFGLQLRLSAQMMRLTYDRDHQKAIAEAVGRQVAGEIMHSRFIQ